MRECLTVHLKLVVPAALKSRMFSRDQRGASVFGCGWTRFEWRSRMSADAAHTLILLRFVLHLCAAFTLFFSP